MFCFVFRKIVPNYLKKPKSFETRESTEKLVNDAKWPYNAHMKSVSCDFKFKLHNRNISTEASKMPLLVNSTLYIRLKVIFIDKTLPEHITKNIL